MKKEKVNEVLELFKECFADNVMAYAYNTVSGLECGVEGKEEFLKQLESKLLEHTSHNVKTQTHKVLTDEFNC
jgi:hypothetical protein